MDRRRSTFLSDLRTVLAERDFRRLFATRLVSQTGDGIITAGVGTYVFFNASSFPDPAAHCASGCIRRPRRARRSCPDWCFFMAAGWWPGGS